jgi:hypothetical protein
MKAWDDGTDRAANAVRWVSFWLFLACFVVAVAEAMTAGERSSLASLPLALVILAVGGVAAIAWQRGAGSGADRPSTLLRSLDSVPDWFVRSLLAGALLGFGFSLLADRVWGWDRVIADAVQSAGMSLLMLSFCCGIRPFRFGR